MKNIAGLFEARNGQHDKGSTPYVVSKMAKDAEGGVVYIPPGIAQRILEEINFPDQRRLKAGRRQDHLERILNDTWINGASTVSFAITLDGQMWLVDGQHRLSAIAQSERSVGSKINIVEVGSFDEVRRLYATFDMKASSRNTGELIDASGVSGETGLKRKIIRAVYNAAPVIINGLEPVAAAHGSGGLRSHESRLGVIAEWEREAASLQEIVDTAQSSLQKKLTRSGTAAVILYTLRHQPQKAQEFWGGLARNDGLRRRDPRSTLIEDMTTRRLSSGSTRQSIQQPAIAWNAFYQNRELKIIKCIDGAPIYVLGTPLASRRK